MEILKGTLYLVGTPIGNLSDISKRALEVLNGVSFIAAEDTRVSLKLLSRFHISKELISYHEHNRKKRGHEIIRRLLEGESCALITDAGMPAISDPGEEVVRLCRENNLPVSVIPGPSALIAALSVSGMFSGRFTFEGFLSTAKKQRKEHLEEIKDFKHTLIFYESPHKLKTTLHDLLEFLGDREITICRELTKVHEEIIHTTIAKAVETYEETPPRGEFVLIVNGAAEEKKEITSEEIKESIEEGIKSGLSKKDAVVQTAQRFDLKKNEVYKLSLEE